jgi:hypothetical protein
MPIVYPMRSFGQFRLGMGVTYKLLQDRFGFDFGQRYHRDLDYRIKTTMEVDQAVFNLYGDFGLGFENPYPRVSIEPFGHRFMPAMFGCPCGFAADGEPWSQPRVLSTEGIDALPPWTVDRFENSEPVRMVLSQLRQLKAHYAAYRKPDREVNPHLENYARLDYVQAFDFGQDTDFEKLGRLCPRAKVNCILFPAWIASHSQKEIREELLRLMRAGKCFSTFSFTCLELDTKLDGEPILAFLETFARCARD